VFALSVVVRLLTYVYTQLGQVSSLERSNSTAMSRAGGLGTNLYYEYVLTLFLVVLLFGGTPFALVVLGRNLAGEDRRRVEMGLAAAFLGVGALFFVVPDTPFELRVAGGVVLGVLSVALPVAVGYRYYARRGGADATGG
jgi:drug/metabolite transporter (DMT)-like permease